jgi:peptide-methionine (R)-S-oxide reductase
MADKIVKSEEEWKEQLSPEAYEVARLKGTERPFTGSYYYHKENGVYRCACCQNELFRSDTKYDSGSGWPSFWEPIHPESVHLNKDTSHGMVRTEVVCAKCDAHLGHLFEDGPQPTGIRYCMNSVSLDFEKKLSIKKPWLLLLREATKAFSVNEELGSFFG